MEAKEVFEKKHYGLVGKHSAVQVCLWTKKALTGKGVCYKQRFYGIESHRCCQLTPALLYCQNRCLHCWRPTELTKANRFNEEPEKPDEIVKKAIEAHRKLLIGFGGNSSVPKKRLNEALNPVHFAISLAGEPTLYPRVGELLALLRKLKKTTFLVTNGLCPEQLDELNKSDNLPTQLYLSVNAASRETYLYLTRSSVKKAWETFLRSVKLFRNLHTRRVFRITLVRDLNMTGIEGYAKLIKLGRPDFVEVKSYMAIGFARQRLGYERMPNHSEVKDFSLVLQSLTGYSLLDEKPDSRVILLGKGKVERTIKS